MAQKSAKTTNATDFTDEERQHKHSLQPAFLHFPFEGHEVPARVCWTLVDGEVVFEAAKAA